MTLSPNLNSALPLVLLESEKEVSWEQLLAPAPLGIAIMSQLMICASRISDIRIDTKKQEEPEKPEKPEQPEQSEQPEQPEKTEQPKQPKQPEQPDQQKEEIKKEVSLIRHPESFRTTLVQIGNDAYTVFMKAHSNMEQIQIQMAQVPGFVQECAKILQSRSKNAIDKILPRRLKRIQDAADDGEKLSKEVANDFNHLIKLISQVLEATSASIGSKEQKIEAQIKEAIEEQKKREMSAKELEHKNTEEERKGYQNILKSLGTAAATTTVLAPLMLVLPEVVIPIALISSLMISSSEQLEQTKLDQAKAEEEMKKINEIYIEKLQNMHIDVTKDISRDKTIEFLNEGLRFLSVLKEKWTGMARFFERVKNVIDKSVAKDLKDFTGDVEEAASDASLMELIADSILKAKLTSHQTYRIAEMYVSVSNRYIIGNVASMHQMMSLKDNEMDEAQKKLLNACEEATKGILTKVREDKEQVIKSITDFQDQMKNQQLEINKAT